MRARFRTIGLAVAALAAFALTNAASAAVLYDDFDEPTVDLTKWKAQWGGFTLPTTIADSKVQLVYPQALESLVEVVPGDSMYFKIGDAPVGLNGFGTTQPSNLGGMGFRNDQGSGYYQFVVWEGTNIWRSEDIGAINSGDILKITWNADGSVAGYKNDVLCGYTDTIVIPSGQIIGFGGGDFLSLDAVSLNQAIPEPSSVVLLGTAIAGLLAYAWRKRR